MGTAPRLACRFRQSGRNSPLPSRLTRNTVISLWLLVLVFCIGYSGLRIHTGDAFESNILGLIPQTVLTGGEDDGRQPRMLDNSTLQKQFVILLSHADPRQGLVLAGDLRSRLVAQPGVELDQSDDLFSQLKDFYRPYRHQLLTPEKRIQLEEMDSVSLARQVVAELYSPVQAVRPYSLVEDPFNLGGSWLHGLIPKTTSFAPGAIPSLRVSSLADAATWYLIRGELAGSPFDLTNQGISPMVEAFRQQHQDARILVSGLVFHGAEGARLSRREISTVGAGSLLGILILVVMVFRSSTPLIAIAFTLVSSLMVALTTSLIVFGSIHLTTLAFGSTLLGLAVDYCFHFLLRYRRKRNALAAGRLMLRGLVLSVGSSTLAYLILLMSPFPGLQQFAVFVASGLLAAGAAVGVLAYCYRESGAPRMDVGDWLFTRYFGPFYGRAARRWMLVCILIALLAPALVYMTLKAGFSDDIRLLSTSSSELLASERKVQQILGGIDTQRYWIVTGDDSQQVLERTEQAVAELAIPVMAASQLVPSLARQQQDHQLIFRKLYSPDGALSELCKQLYSSSEPHRANDCAPWENQRRQFSPGLIQENVPAAISRHFPALALGDHHHSLIFPYLARQESKAEAASPASESWLHHVDQVEIITDTLAAFRVEVSELFALFLAVFGGACLWFYRTKGLLILSCVLISLLVGLALSSSAGITLFHLLALLLVMGISVDTVIFYLELGLDGDSWLASTMGMLTSVLAFGLLSLSQVPLLHQFGSVVFFGLLCAWLITPVLYQIVESRFPRVARTNVATSQTTGSRK